MSKLTHRLRPGIYSWPTELVIIHLNTRGSDLILNKWARLWVPTLRPIDALISYVLHCISRVLALCWVRIDISNTTAKWVGTDLGKYLRFDLKSRPESNSSIIDWAKIHMYWRYW